MSAVANPRVMVASDDAFELTTMSASLRLNGVNVVAEANNKAVAENIFRSLQPEVLIIDLMFANSVAISMMMNFRKTNPALGIVLMTACPDLRFLGVTEKSIPQGVQIVLKRSVADLSVLNHAIALSIDDFSKFHPAQWIKSHSSIHENAFVSILNNFTDIQVATLRLVAQGLSNSEIAKIRFVSEKSVEQIVARIAQHLNVIPDRSKNLRVVITGEYFKWIGAPRHL
ncbi:MAG: LuxR C-terminal-related transcriptional regulator [Candidatus Planktophila sp.]